MYCSKCGMENQDNAIKCARCEEVLNPGALPDEQPKKIPNYLVQAILVTIFCCLPFGIPAIVFAAQVNGNIQAGNIPVALENSRKARLWCWVSFWVGLATAIIWLLFVVGMGGMFN